MTTALSVSPASMLSLKLKLVLSKMSSVFCVPLMVAFEAVGASLTGATVMLRVLETFVFVV